MGTYIWVVCGLSVNLRIDTQIDMCLKETGLRAQDMLAIRGSIVNMIGET